MKNPVGHESRLYAVDPAALETLLGLGAPDDAPLAAPVAVPGYRLVREVRRGGQGVVYEGVAPDGRGRVAVKILREGPFAGASQCARLEREVQVLARFRHPNVVTVIDRGTAPGGWQYLVTGWVDGVPLDAYLERLAQDQEPADAQRNGLRLFVSVCDALAVAHAHGVVHRDVKPSNILVDAGGEPHVLDFGLAFEAAGRGARAVTDSGQFVGSLPWSSPEQLAPSADGIDARSDVYSLGVILFQILSGGEFPYPVDGPLPEVVRSIMTAPPRRSRRAARSPAGLEAIVRRALAKRPADRFADAGGLGEAIRRHLEAPQSSRRRWAGRRFAIGAVTAVVLAAPAAGLYYTSRVPAGFATSAPMTRPAAAPAPGAARPSQPEFTLFSVRTFGPRARAVCAADFDGDGSPDLAAVSAGSGGDDRAGAAATVPRGGAVDVYPSRGDGTFGPPATYAAGRVNFSQFLLAADVNGDRRPDLVTGSDLLGARGLTSVLAVLVNRGDGTFADPLFQPCDHYPSSAAAGDFTGDGRADLVVVNGRAKVADVFVGNGDGSFARGTRVGNVMSPSLAVDADGDGRLDVATAWMGCAVLLFGDGRGGFARRQDLNLSNTIRSVALLDATGDGRPDLVGTLNNHMDTAKFIVWPGGPAAPPDARRFDRPPVITRAQYPCDAGAGDFNGDGHVDLLARVNGWSQEFTGVQLWLGAGDGTFGSPSMLFDGLGEGASADGVAVADFNRDGRPDAAVAGGTTPAVVVLMNRPATESGVESAPRE